MTEQRIRMALGALLALAAAYTVHRAVVLRIEYYDGYEYLLNTRALLGDRAGGYNPFRPPLLSVLQLPAVAVGRASAPASPVRLLAPHLTAALCSLLAAAAVFLVLRRPFSPTFALLGPVLFVGNRLFIRYGAHVMADLLSAGLAAATVALYLRARERPASDSFWGPYALCGAALGAAVLAKFPVAALGFVLAFTEVWLAVRERRLERRRALGLALAGTVAVAVFYGVNLVLLAVNFRATAFQKLAWFAPRALVASASHPVTDESWRDWGAMALIMLSGPTLVAAGLGLVVALRERQTRDVPFLVWLGVLGVVIVFVIGHNEARYLLPVVPAILYFAVRVVERLAEAVRPRWERAGAVARAAVATGAALLLGGALRVGVEQAIQDRDPVFLADVERRAAALLVGERRARGRLLWLGDWWHTFHPRRMIPVPGDEFWSTFHFTPSAAQYLIGLRPAAFSVEGGGADLAALAGGLRNGDAVMRVADEFFDMTSLPPGGVPDVEVWSVHRLDLTPSGGGTEWVGANDTSVSLGLREENGRLTARTNSGAGRFALFAAPAHPGELPRLLGELVLEPGTETLLAPGRLGDLRGLFLFRLDRTPVRVE